MRVRYILTVIAEVEVDLDAYRVETDDDDDILDEDKVIDIHRIQKMDQDTFADDPCGFFDMLVNIEGMKYKLEIEQI